MKFTCSIESIEKLLGISESIISAKNTISILSNVLIEAKDSKITIKACDTSLSFFGEIGADIEEEGAISVYSNKLYSIAKKLPSEEILIETDENFNVSVRAKGKNNILYNLKGINPEKFPEIMNITNVEYFSISKEIFTDMVNKTKFAVSQNESRKFASGTLLEYKEKKLKMVSTDGKRLAKIEREVAIPDSFHNIIVPPKILNEVTKLCGLSDQNGDIRIAVTGKELLINVDNCFFISSLLDANFPAYDSVIPNNLTNNFKVNRKEFKDAIERVGLMGDKDTHKIIIFLSKGKLKMYTENMSLGFGEETIDIEYDKEEMKIAFNYNYVIDVINVIKNDNVIFKFSNAVSTITILEEGNENYIYIMMPMSL